MTQLDIQNSKLLAVGISDACRMISLARSTLYREISAGRLKAHKAGRRTLFSVDELMRWLASLPKAKSSTK